MSRSQRPAAPAVRHRPRGCACWRAASCRRCRKDGRSPTRNCRCSRRSTCPTRRRAAPPPARSRCARTAGCRASRAPARCPWSSPRRRSPRTATPNRRRGGSHCRPRGRASRTWPGPSPTPAVRSPSQVRSLPCRILLPCHHATAVILTVGPACIPTKTDFGTAKVVHSTLFDGMPS